MTLAGVVTLLIEEHENSAPRTFSSDRDCLAPHVHSRRAKGSVRSCCGEMASTRTIQVGTTVLELSQIVVLLEQIEQDSDSARKKLTEQKASRPCENPLLFRRLAAGDARRNRAFVSLVAFSLSGCFADIGRTRNKAVSPGMP